MKKYITLAFLISVTTCCFGQIENFDKIGEQDTVKCVMLISDTASTKYSTWATGTISSSILKKDDNYLIGYEVYKYIFYEIKEINDGFNFGVFPAHVSRELQVRLDEDKKPLNKNIIVWQSKYL